MTSTIAKQYIDEQITTFRHILDSFPKHSMGDDFLAYDAEHMIWDTLYTLHDVKMTISDAQTKEQVMESLEELRAEYADGFSPNGSRIHANVETAITRIISAVRNLYDTETETPIYLA